MRGCFICSVGAKHHVFSFFLSDLCIFAAARFSFFIFAHMVHNQLANTIAAQALKLIPSYGTQNCSN
jgi:hypothetical protein